MRHLILVKLGGSLITNKARPFVEDLKVIKCLVKEISRAKKASGKLLIIGHGGGSYPHVPAVKYQTAQGLINKRSYRGIAIVQDAAARLDRIVIREFINAGENAVSLNPSSFMITQNGEIKKAYLEPLLKLLEFKMLPVVYGDVVLDLNKGCCILSTEKILSYLAQRLNKIYEIEKVIHCGKTDGVYDQKGKVVKTINQNRFRTLKKEIGESDGFDVTGGMFHKVSESLKLAKKRIPSMIINGTKNKNLEKEILGKRVLGTKIV